MGITCVVPARNESGHLRSVISEITSISSISQIIIVEGGSTDETWEVAQEIASASEFKIKAIKQTGRGKFNAVICGTKLADNPMVLIWDADGTVSLEDSKKIITYSLASDSIAAVMGNRLAGKIHSGAMKPANWLGNWLFAFLWWPFLGLKKFPRDLLCGTKIIPTHIFEKMPAWLIRIDPFGDFAILATCLRNQTEIKSLSVDYYPRSYGSTNIKRWSGGMKLLLTSAVSFAWILVSKFKRTSVVSPNLRYFEQLESQRENSKIPGLQIYLDSLYNRIRKNLVESEKYLEIGGGVGASKDFFGDFEILCTDYLNSSTKEVLGNIDAHALPFSECEFDGVILFDALHHLNNPLLALRECLRVTKPGGKIFIIEPYVSILSYPVYKLFHFEDTSWRIDIEKGLKSTKNPEEGNQGISRALLKSLKLGRLEFALEFSNISYDLIDPFSFFLTGGTSNPLKTPKKVIKLVLLLESLIPSAAMKYICSRVFITITKGS